MIKLLAIDCDGTLVNCADLHYLALNKALEETAKSHNFIDMTIARHEHETTYNGLPTKVKLKMLNKEGLPDGWNEEILVRKQMYTNKLIKQQIHADDYRPQQLCLQQLKADGYTICVASNAIRETVKLLLSRAGYIEYIDDFLSNEDVKKSKPNPEIFLRCMIEYGVSPKEVLIVEDSQYGFDAAEMSCGHLMKVNGPQDITYEKITKKIDEIERT